MTPIWESIQCPRCPEPFDEQSWNDRHSIGFDEIHSHCCDGCDADDKAPDGGHHGCRDECE